MMWLLETKSVKCGFMHVSTRVIHSLHVEPGIKLLHRVQTDHMIATIDSDLNLNLFSVDAATLVYEFAHLRLVRFLFTLLCRKLFQWLVRAHPCG